MKASIVHRRWLGATCVIAAALVSSSVGTAQILQPVSDTRSCYAKAVACHDSLERFSAPVAPFAIFSDTLRAGLGLIGGCETVADAHAIQYSTILGDSIWVEARFYTYDGGPNHPFKAIARSDVTIRFRIPAGQQCQCAYDLDFSGANFGFGRGTMTWSFVKVGPTGPISLGSLEVHLWSPGQQSGAEYHETTLHGGDYILDVHLFGDDGGPVYGTMLAFVKLSQMIAVSETTWSRVKGFYR